MLPADPQELFDGWMSDVIRAGLPEPTAMVLATVSADQRPRARMVLLKSSGPDGFTFYTNRTSRKATDLAEADTYCTICQYLVQRIRGEMLMNGIGGGLPFGQTPPLVGVPRFSAGGVRSDVMNPSALFTPPVPAPPGGVAPPMGAAGETTFLEMGAEKKKGKGKPKMSPAKRLDMEFNKKISWKNDKDAAYTKGMMRKMHKLDFMAKARIPYPRRTSRLVLRHFRPPQIRYADMYDGPLRAAKRAQERFENNQMNTVVYEQLRDICAKHVPGVFSKYCYPVLKSYQQVSEGLMYKDRPDAICMQIGGCGAKSYIRQSAHAVVSP